MFRTEIGVITDAQNLASTTLISTPVELELSDLRALIEHWRKRRSALVRARLSVIAVEQQADIARDVDG
jgi:hypothetical protein